MKTYFDLVKHNFGHVRNKLIIGQAVEHSLEHANHHHKNPLLSAAIKASTLGSAAEAGSIFAWGRAATVLGGISTTANFATAGLAYAWGVSKMPFILYGSFFDPYSFRNRTPESGRIPIRQRTIHESRNPASFSSSLRNSHAQTSSFLKSQFKSFSSLGYPSSYTSREFRDVVRATGLVDSYNNIHPESKIEHLKGHRGEIGGVASSVGRIEGFKDSATEVLFDEHIFCMPNHEGKPPFSDAQLKQILRELSVGIYLHNTYPFFSLHFNNYSSMYPVLHSIYQNTLVGEVIGVLDYFMKGFLNGGIFDKDFLKKWPENQNLDREFLKSKLIDLKKEYQKNKEVYNSLREKMCAVGLELPPGVTADESKPSVFNNKFRTSFRIIAKQKSIQKHENMFLIDPDFDVEYTIETLPEYQEYLDQFYRTHGKYPDDYQKLLNLYKKECDDIKEQMPKLPLFREYFQMLGVINFFCYYLTTLKDMGKSPELTNTSLSTTSAFPKVMPPIPVRHYKYQPFQLTIGDVLKAFETQEHAQLNQFLRESVDGLHKDCPEKMQGIIHAVFHRLLASKKVPADVINQEDFIEKIAALETGFARFLKGNAVSLKQEWHDLFKKIIDRYELDIQLETIDSMKTMQEKFTALSTAAQKKLTTNTQSLNQQAKETNVQLKATIEKAKLDRIKEELTKIDKQIPQVIAEETKQLDEEAQQLIAKKTQEINTNRTASLNQINAQWTALHHKLQKLPANQSIHNQSIANCNSAYNKMLVDLTQNVTARTAKLKAGLPQDVKQRCDMAKKKLEAEITAFYEMQLKNGAVDIEAKRKEAEQAIAEENENCLKAIEGLKAPLDNIYGLLSSSPDIISKDIVDQIQYSSLDIADSGYYQEAGDNHRIVGGCGMQLPTIKQKPIPMGDKLFSAFFPVTQAASPETMIQANYNGKTYSIFKLKTKNQPAYSLLDYADILDSAVKQTVPMSDNELNVISELNYEQLANDTVTLPKFNAVATDKLGQATIHHVANFGDAKQLEKIVQGNESCLTLADMHGHLPIHTAAIAGNIEAVSYFAAKNAKLIHAKNHNGSTPLLLASQQGHTTVVEKLLTLGADANYSLPNGLFALYIAIQNGHEDTALTLIEKAKGINLNAILDSGNSALHLAIETKQTKVALALLAHGADGNLKRKTDGYTPFYCAAENGLTEVCQAMYATGKIDVNRPLASQKTAVHLAAIHGNLETLQWLNEKCKVNVNAKTSEGDTAIISALQHGQFETALYLASHSAINTVNNEGQTASSYATMMGQFEVADILIHRGENPELKDKDNRNYIYYLIRSGQYNRYKALLEKNKLDPNLTFNGLTSLDIAAMYGHKLLIDLLTARNAKFTLDQTTGWELIHFAVKANHLGFLKKWLQTQKDPKRPISQGNDKSKTLSFIAAENGSFECLRELLKTMTKDDLSKSFANQHLLYAAVKSGKKKIVDAVLAKCDDANIPIDDHHNTIAHLVAKLGLVNILKHIEVYGANFTAKNKQGLTCFHFAILNDNDYLLAKLLKLVPAGEWPQDLFAFALENNKMQCLDTLAKKSKQYGADPKVYNKALIKACQSGQLDDVILLLNLGADLNGHTEGYPLHEAISAGHIAIVDLLIRHGADPSQVSNGASAFAVAVKSQQIEVIRLFQQLGFSDELSKYVTLANEIKPKIIDVKAVNYTLQAVKNSFVEFDRDKEALMQALKEVDEAKFKTILATFPVNNVLFPYENSALPLLQIALKMEAEWAVKLLLEHGADALCKDMNGFNVYHQVAKSGEHKSQRLVKLLDKHLGKYKDSLLRAETSDGISVFHIAAKNNNSSLLNLFNSSTYMHDCYQNGNSLLHIAVQMQNMDVVKALLARGVNVNAENDQQITPLMLAAQAGNAKLVQLLLAHGAEIDKKDIKQNTALHYAIISENQEIALQLAPLMRNVHCKNVKGNTPFMLAAVHGLLPVLSAIVKINPSCQQVNKRGLNALHLAAIYGYSDAVSYLVQQGFDIDVPQRLKDEKKAKSKTQLTSLQLAARQGNIETCETLIALGASITKADNFSNDLIEYALTSHKPETVELIKLLNLELKPQHLLTAAANNHVEMLSELLLMGWDIDVQDQSGQNALHVACANRAEKSTALLIEQGIQLETTDFYGNTPLHEAAKSGSVNILRQLCAHEIRLDKPNNKGKTPLHLACENGNYASVLQLLKSGANACTVDKDNLTPALAAAQKGFLAIAKLLIVFGDRSLIGKTADSLPTYIKNSLTPFKWELKAIEESLVEADANQSNPIQLAIMLNQTDALRLLCQQHPEYINQQNSAGDTPLHLAVTKGNIEAARVLIEYKAKQDIKNKNAHLPLHITLLKSHEDLSKLFIGTGGFDTKTIEQIKNDVANMHFKNGCELYNKQNYLAAFDELNRAINLRPDHYASYHYRGCCYYNHGKDYRKAIIEFEQALKVNPNYFESYLMRGLAYLNCKEHTKSLADLDQAIKIDPKREGVYYHRSIVHFNLNNDQKAADDIHEALRINPSNTTYLSLAAKITTKLIEAAKQKLIEGAKLGNLQLIEEALKAGADINLTADEKYQCTALHWASMQGHTAAVDLLLSRGAEVNAKDKSDWTPLHQAARNNKHGDVIQRLIKAGADMNARDKTGASPYDVAHKNNPQIVSFIPQPTALTLNYNCE